MLEKVLERYESAPEKVCFSRSCSMGQFWQWLCPSKKETLSTHELSYGLKWFEQFAASGMYSAIMMLKTDVSSLGDGGGDLEVKTIPSPLQPLVKAVLGRWTGDIVELAGDYGKIYETCSPNDEWTDISANVAAAVFSVCHEGWYDEDKSADANIETLKLELTKHPDFAYCSFEDKEFIRLIEMALKSTPGATSSDQILSGKRKNPASDNQDKPAGKGKKQAV